MASADAEEEEEVLIEEIDNSEFVGEPSAAQAASSALDASKAKSKELSYYYAQEATRADPFPADAKIREFDPLFRADGLGPKKLEASAAEPGAANAPAASAPRAEPRTDVKWIQKFSFSDDGDKVKVYVDFPESIKGAEISCTFGRFSVELLVKMAKPGLEYGFAVQDTPGWILEHERRDGFPYEIVPEESKHRVSSSGEKITITLKKLSKDGGRPETWTELKKKTGRNF
eukprot:TRINITY_DN18709_c0_g1_i1.p1 TRINITY_DN18709_c0_g1~~TRINITY_DN18709_c0_g1_i1.p1  ORF type:complete len:230 (+),score=70.02 TRINITY_DN18709_c0_g1_i1:74-763(+)